MSHAVAGGAAGLQVTSSLRLPIIEAASVEGGRCASGTRRRRVSRPVRTSTPLSFVVISIGEIVYTDYRPFGGLPYSDRKDRKKEIPHPSIGICLHLFIPQSLSPSQLMIRSQVLPIARFRPNLISKDHLPLGYPRSKKAAKLIKVLTRVYSCDTTVAGHRVGSWERLTRISRWLHPAHHGSSTSDLTESERVPKRLSLSRMTPVCWAGQKMRG